MPVTLLKSTKKKNSKRARNLSSLFSLKFASLLLVAGFALVGGLLLVRSFAATSPLYLSPETQTVPVGTTFAVDVRTNISSAIDGVDATLTYDPAVMDFVSVNGTNSAFPVELTSTGGNGQVRITRGIFSPATVTGDSLVATVTFTAKAASAGSSLQLTGNATYQGSYLNPGTSGATVVVTNPAPPPPPAGDSTLPLVTISQPLNSARPSKNKFIVNASATDNVGVVKMQVVIDGSVVLTSSSSPVSYTWGINGKKVATGAHVIAVRAYDAAGNIGTASVTVYK